MGRRKLWHTDLFSSRYRDKTSIDQEPVAEETTRNAVSSGLAISSKSEMEGVIPHNSVGTAGSFGIAHELATK